MKVLGIETTREQHAGMDAVSGAGEMVRLDDSVAANAIRDKVLDRCVPYYYTTGLWERLLTTDRAAL